MGRLKVGVSSECHDVVFAQSLTKPIGDSCLSDIMERAFVHAGFQQDLPKGLPEVVNDLVLGAEQSPSASWA